MRREVRVWTLRWTVENSGKIQELMVVFVSGFQFQPAKFMAAFTTDNVFKVNEDEEFKSRKYNN